MHLIRFAVLFLTILPATAETYEAELQGRFVELPTAKLWILDSGGSGEAVILLHPRTGNSEFWQQTMPVLAEAGYRAIAIDNPGWGKSVVNNGQDSVPVAETIDALLDHLALEEAHIVGTAMGGYVALDYAAWRPGRTTSLVIAASGLGLQDDPDYTAFRERAEIPVMETQPSHIREMSPTYRGMKPDGVARWQAIYANAQQQGAVRPPLLSPNTPEKLASLESPTLVVAGGTDLVTPSGAMRLWSRHITAPSEFKVIAEAGHVLVWEQPEIFNEVLIDFLERQAGH